MPESPAAMGAVGGRAASWPASPMSRQRGQEGGPSVKLAGSPGDQAPGGEHEVQVLAGPFPASPAVLGSQAEHGSPLTGRAPTLLRPTPHFSTAFLGSHHPPASTNRTLFTQSLRGRTQNPQLPWGLISVTG